jgi:hypothetical protein
MATLYFDQNDEPVTIEYDFEGELPAQPSHVLAEMVRIETNEYLGFAVIDTRTTRVAGKTTYERFHDEVGARAKYRFLWPRDLRHSVRWPVYLLAGRSAYVQQEGGLAGWSASLESLPRAADPASPPRRRDRPKPQRKKSGWVTGLGVIPLHSHSQYRHRRAASSP